MIEADELHDVLSSVVAAALTVPLPCLLCGRPPRYNGVFVAKDQRRVAAPAGKVRVVRYSLCKKCARKSSTQERVESRILGDCDALARVN